MPATRKLSLRLLGEVEAQRGDERVPLPRSKKTRALLAYLIAADRPQRRDRLCSIFWEVADDPRGELRWCLSKLRRIVDEPESKRILADRETVGFDASGMDVDLLRLRALAKRAFDTAEIAELQAVAESFRGVFLEGLELPNCPQFIAWCLAEREQTRRLHADILRQLLTRLSDSPTDALEHARRLVEVDPDSEAAHAALIEHLVACGRRPEAEQHGRHAERHLGDIGAKPSAALIKARQRLTKRQAPTQDHELGERQESPPVNPLAPPGEQTSDSHEPERKQLTILVASISDAASPPEDMDPEDALQRLDPALEAMKLAVTRYGGTITNLPGDGLMALFGAPLAYEDHAARACIAALAMREALRGPTDAELDIRIGLHSGEVVVRTVEDGRSRHVEAVGPAVALARDIKDAVEAGAIGLTAETNRSADGFIRVRPLDTADGVRQHLSVTMFELLERTAARSRWEARTTRALTKFVGREEELAQICRAHERSDAGEGKLLAIVGEPGQGKSRLAHEFIQSPKTRGWQVLRTGATAHSQNAAYRPMSELLRSWCAVGERDNRTAIAEKLRQRVAALDATLLTMLPPLLFLLDLPVDDEDWQQSSPAKRRRRVQETLRLLLLRISRERPLILLVEDLHWIDGETHAFLDTLVEALASARMFVLVTYRPEFRHEWAGKRAFALVHSESLRSETAEQLLEALLGDDPSLAALKPRLIERSGGNPLFLEEMGQALLETGAVTGDSGHYRLAAADASLEMPTTISEVLTARIDRLPAASKGLLQVAAVIGQDVPLALLQPIAGLPEDDLHDELANLRFAELLYETRLEPDSVYSFKHALTQEAALNGVLRERRRQLHIQVVETIEGVFRKRLEEQIEALAHHALAGGLWRKAITYLEQAGDKAVGRSAYQEASRFYEQALETLEDLPEERDLLELRIDICLKLRVALNAISSLQPMFDHLREAEALAERIDDHQRRAEINLAKIWAQGLLGDVEGAIESGRRAAASGQVLDARSVVACADLGIGWAHWQKGEAREAADFLARHKDYLSGDLRFETFGSISVRSVFCLSNLARNQALLGDFPEAIASGSQGCQIAEELGRPFDLAYAYWHFGSALLHKGEIDEALSYLTQAYEINQANEFEFTAVGTSIDLGYAHLISRQLAEAIPLLDRARSRSQRSRHAHNNTWATIYLGLAKLCEGSRDQARDLGQEALAAARACSFRRAEGFALQLLGIADSSDDAQPEAAEAEEHLMAARALFEDLGLRPDLAHCHHDLAALYKRMGRTEAADGHLESATRLSATMDMALHRARVTAGP